MLKKIKDFFEDESASLQSRTFAFYLLITTLVLFVSFIYRVLIIGFCWNTLVFLLSLIIISIMGFTIFKLKIEDKGIYLFSFYMILIFFPAIFMTGGGIYCDAPAWFIYNVLIISNIVSNGKYRQGIIIIQEIIGIVLYFFVSDYTDLTTLFSPFRNKLISFLSLILISISIAVIIYFRILMYKSENMKAVARQKEVEGLIASQNRFFSSMSHEIRTPINTIIGLNEMILREDINDEITEDAINIRSAGKMLLNTINDILDMSKFQSGDMKLLIEKYATGSMLSEMVGMLWIKAKEKNLDFHINVAPDVPSELMGDEIRIKQILLNILNNAIKYTKEGSISLSVECVKLEDNMINMIYTVADTGMGIKKEDIPYLFTAFKRVDESNVKHIEGTGLGLSIVKQFLDLMGGKVTVNSIYTKGSTFIIEIPQKAASNQEIGEYDYFKRHKEAQRTNYKQSFEAPDAKLLVVDDNESNLMVVTKLLRATKVQLDTAISGKEALEKTLDTAYDLIFMDHLMPEMDGIECFNAIRKQVGGKSKKTPIVILTANADEQNRVLYAKTGFNGYLVKPVTGNDLETEVYNQLPSTLVRNIDNAFSTSEGGESISVMSDSQKKKKVVITTESTADLPDSLLTKYGIPVFLQKIRTAEGVFRESLEIDTAGLMKYLENENNRAYPVLPTVDEYEEFFAEQLEGANNIIHISLSGAIEQSCYHIAKEAASSFDNVTVIDSRNLSTSQGIVALMACRMAEAGMSVSDIKERMERLIPRIRATFMVNSMEHMARAGYTSKGFSDLMNALMLRPVTVIKNGTIKSNTLLFGSGKKLWKKYIQKNLSGVKLDKLVIFVNYVGLSKSDLEWIKNEIKTNYDFENIFMCPTCPIVAISCGPGAFGISVVAET